MNKKLTTALFLIFGSACIASQEPPPPTKTVTVDYGDRVYVATSGGGGYCPYAGPFRDIDQPGNVKGVQFFDQETLVTNRTRAHNCFIELEEGSLEVEAVPVSNLQFQLCVDSGVCERPDPIDQDPKAFCTDSEAFYDCPIVSVTHFEARRYCNFIGRRLPSGLEHLIFRTAGSSTTSDVPEFPRNDGEPDSKNCDTAVLDGCGPAPSPMQLGDPEAPVGAGVSDVLEGIYDLTGNVQEWSADFLPSDSTDLPWFCKAAIAAGGDGNGPATPRSCPQGELCVYGRVQLEDGTVDERWPVCVAYPQALIPDAGTLVTSFGASYNLQSARDHTSIGPYHQNTEGEVAGPDANDTTVKHKGLGFRCVGIQGDDQTLVKLR